MGEAGCGLWSPGFLVPARCEGLARHCACRWRLGPCGVRGRTAPPGRASFRRSTGRKCFRPSVLFRSGLKEANDVVLYLKPLRSLLEEMEQVDFSNVRGGTSWAGCDQGAPPCPLTRAFPQVPTYIAKVLFTIAFIWANSEHYNTPSRLIVMLQEVCNLLIEMVRLQPRSDRYPHRGVGQRAWVLPAHIPTRARGPLPVPVSGLSRVSQVLGCASPTSCLRLFLPVPAPRDCTAAWLLISLVLTYEPGPESGQVLPGRCPLSGQGGPGIPTGPHCKPPCEHGARASERGGP